jgi:hypothetical protein
MSFVMRMVVGLVLALAVASVGRAQDAAGVGLITAVDLATRTLTLETARGPQTVSVAPAASLRGVRAWADLAPGDAVAYQVVGGRVTRLDVARHFWALPSGPDVPERAQR